MKFSTIFSVYDPSKKAHPHHKIQAFLDAERHKFLERQDSSALWAREMPKIQPQKDTNFANAIILWHFGPEKCQNQPQKIHEFWQCHNSLLPWARESPNPTVKDMNFAQNCTH